jgi:phage shock protein PspC (stress-responsive transcriptional regulator)
MNKIIRKLTSRKLWMAIAGVATGIALVLGVDGGDITNVAGAITAVASVITYIVTEGKIDAERVKVAIEETQKAVETIEGTEGK